MDANTPPGNPSEVIDIKIATIFKREDGIVCVNTKNDVEITLEDAKESIEVIRSFADGGKVLVLAFAGSGGRIQEEVKGHWLSNEKDNPVLAEAIVTKTLAHNILVNFTLKFYKLGKPMKMFTKEDEAVKWLIDIRDKYNRDKKV